MFWICNWGVFVFQLTCTFDPSLTTFIVFEAVFLQCLQSSLARDGGTNLGHRFIKKFKKTLKTFIKWSQLLPETFEILLRPVWWVTDREQQYHPSSLAGGRRATEPFWEMQILIFRFLSKYLSKWHNIFLCKHMKNGIGGNNCVKRHIIVNCLHL